MGTSGWQYADWRDRLYPKGVAQRVWLEHYAARFRTVELNNSFYRLPSRETFAQWRTRTPDDFVLAVKASRYLTHLKRLREPDEPVARLLDAASGLGPKLGPLLVQLPGSFSVDAERLAAALERFPRPVRVAVEVRHDSWYQASIRQVLAERDAALCWADRGARWLTPRWRTAGWGYVRFHWGGTIPDPCYAATVLAQRARDVAARYGPGDDVYVYFNNDPAGCAPRDAAVFARACADLGLEPTRVPPLDEVPVG